MTQGELTTIVAALSALIMAGIAISKAIPERHKIRAEAQTSESSGAQTVTNAAVALIKPLEDRIRTLEQDKVTGMARDAEREAKIAQLEADLERERRERAKDRAIFEDRLMQMDATIELLSHQILASGQKPIAGPKA